MQDQIPHGLHHRLAHRCGMNDGKLVPGLNSRISSQSALARTLRVRLSAAVQRCKELTTEPESIHQLRVATRRATAALRLAKGSVPERRRQRAMGLLRRSRRAAGKVRDIDIFLCAVHDSAEAGTFLAGHIAYSRVVNFENLQSQVSDLLSVLTKLARSLPRSVEAENGERFVDVHSRHCRLLIREFDSVLDHAAVEPNIERLHILRIHAKRLRYAVELTAANNAKLSSIVTQIEKLQEILGAWRDASAVRERLVVARMAAVAVNGAAGSPVARGIDNLDRQYRRVQDRQFAAYRRWTKAWLTFRKRNSPKALFPK